MKRTWLGLLLLSAATFSVMMACTGDDPVPFNAVVPMEGGPAVTSDEGGTVDGAAASDVGVDAPSMRISIAGRLITNRTTSEEEGLFVPLTGPAVSVYIGGKKVPAVAADGTFTLADVVTPYDAFVVERNASRGTHVTGYLGLTRVDPVLFGGAGGTPEFEAIVTGTLAPAPTGGAYALIAVGEPGGGQHTTGFADETLNGMYSMGDVHWASDPAPQVTAAAYTANFDSTTFLPTSFLSYGVTAPFVPVTGGASAVKDILLSQVTNLPAHVAINLPAGFVIGKRILSYQPAAGPTFLYDTTDPSPTTLDLAVPSNATGQIYFRAAPSNVGGLTDAVEQILRPIVTGSQTLTVPAITSRVTGPADGAIGTGTPIGWSTTSNAAYRLFIYPSAGITGGSVVLALNTTSAGALMPDLSKLGVTLTAGATYDTQLYALSPFGSIDDICGPNVALGFQTNTLAVGTRFTAK